MANRKERAKPIRINCDIASKVPLNTVIAEGNDHVTRFSDLAWDVGPLIGATNIPASNKVVRFDFEITGDQKASEVNGQTLIQTMKEFAYARLHASC